MRLKLGMKVCLWAVVVLSAGGTGWAQDGNGSITWRIASEEESR